MANQLREMVGMASSLRALQADLLELKDRSVQDLTQSPVTASGSDFFVLIPEATATGAFSTTQKISSLMVLVKDLKPEEKKTRSSVTVRFLAQVEGHSVCIAAQSLVKDGAAVLTIPCCGLKSIVELEFDGAASVIVWGI